MDKLALLGVHIVEGLFFCGMIGACCVVLLSAAEDVRNLIHKDASH